MNRRDIVLALAALGAAPRLAAQAARVPTIGTLSGSAVTDLLVRDFFKGMAELGYEEGKNVRYLRRHGDGTNQTALQVARELVAAKVDLIWAPGTQVVTAARLATNTLPIVFALVSDPVASGLVQSLARPGTNATGLTILNADTGAKRIQLLDEIFPKLKRVGVLHNPADTASIAQLSVVSESLHALGKEMLVIEASAPKQIAPALARLAAWRPSALVILENAFFVANRKTLLEFAAKHRWPTINSSNEWVDAGGVLSYGAAWGDSCRRSAVYVDKILKGAKPADLPVERAAKFELIINLKAAKAMGLSIPGAVRLRADQVIE